jgi:hypothetical protein
MKQEPYCLLQIKKERFGIFAGFVFISELPQKHYL